MYVSQVLSLARVNKGIRYFLNITVLSIVGRAVGSSPGETQSHINRQIVKREQDSGRQEDG